MRILINHTSSTPDVLTGITNYTWCIAEALAVLQKQDVFLSTNWASDRVPRTLTDAGITVFSNKNFANESLAFGKNAVTIPKLAKRLAADVVFTPHPYGVPFGSRANVFVLHDLYRRTYPALHSFSRRAQWNMIFPLGLHRADSVICVSAATRDDLVRHYPSAAGKAVVVHEASSLPGMLASAAENPIGGRYALMVANLTPTKNVTVLFDALRLLIDEGKTIKLVLVGQDPDASVAAFRARAPNAQLIHLESMERERLAALYKHATCYVNTSLAEGFCLPVLEAQTFGAPVICSDLPVLHEVAGYGAIFVDPRDAHALARAMRKMFDDEAAAQELSQRGRINAAKFSWRRAGEETLRVLEETAAQRRSRSANPLPPS